MRKRVLGSIGRDPVAYLGLVVLGMALLFYALEPSFFTWGNVVDLVEGDSVTAILAVGLFVVLVAGGIDISFAATASVAQYVGAYAATRLNCSMPVVLLISLGSGALLGFLNAWLIDRLRAVSIIVSISTMSLYFALLMYFSGGKYIYGFPSWLSDPVVLFQLSGADSHPVKVTIPVAVMLVVAMVTAFIMKRTALGRQVYAFGGNPEAAKRAGINLFFVQAFAYGYLGLLAGLAGLVQAHRTGESVPAAMVGGELFVLAAAVLGGASLTGGCGSVGGVMLGVLLLAMLRNGLNLIGISPYFFQIVLGLVILTSATVSGLKARR